MRWIAAFILALLSAAVVTAQEPTPPPATNANGSIILPGSVPTSVWVTTQDVVALREGPGRGFPRVAVVPDTVTIPAYGRTSDTSWIQVEYEGQRGWIAARLLVWSGNVIDLPVDGVTPAPFIRRAAALGVTTRETPIYDQWVTPEDQVGVIPAGSTVELTGRIGGDTGANYFRLQIRYDGQLYWVGSWDIRILDGDYRRLLDLASLFPYGRLHTQLERNLAQTLGSFNQIDSVWTRLSQGAEIACSPIPPEVRRLITSADAAREPTFLPAVNALSNAIDGINGAITAFRDACADPTFVLTREVVDAQNATLDEAYRNLILAGSLLEPLRRRNPTVSS
jgi:uncharacterized protein YraI